MAAGSQDQIEQLGVHSVAVELIRSGRATLPISLSGSRGQQLVGIELGDVEHLGRCRRLEYIGSFSRHG